jgi:hypothetical protein
MDRARLLLCAFALAALFASPASAALFEDDFEDESGGDPLNAADWDVNDSDGAGTDMTVDVSDEGADTNWASFEFSVSAGNDDWGRSKTDDEWSVDAYGSLVWAIDFRVQSGTKSTLVVPFLFDTGALTNGDEADGFKQAELAIVVEYEDGWATLWRDGVSQTSLRNGQNELFEPDMDNHYTQELTVTLDDTNIAASLLGTDDNGDQDTYTATLAHELDTSTAGHFGMRVDNENGTDAKVAQFDNVLLTPEPATLAFLALGAILTLARRRRRA